MKNVSKLRLSLRKLFIATLAAGPMAVLPSPVWAVLPTASSFTVANGTASVTLGAAGNIVTISTTDRAILMWGNNTLQSAITGAAPAAATDTVTNFYIEAGQTYNFALPPGGSMLNRVKQGNATASLGASMGAVINGTLISDGKVFIVADTGNITVGTGAVINTAGGLVLSTLNEASDGPFLSTGDFLYTDDTTTRNISIANPVVTGSLSAYSATTSVAGIDAKADLVLRSVKPATAMPLGAMTVGGNLTVVSNKGAITQTGATVVGFSTADNQVASFSTSGGDNAITLTNAGNNFERVTFSTANGAVSITDISAISLGASTTNSSLTVTSTAAADTLGINFNGGTAIGTYGTVTVGGAATFSSQGYGSAINIGNNSSIGGTLSGTTANGGFTFNGTGNPTTGNLTVGNINSATAALASITLGGVTVNATTGAVENYPTPGSYQPALAATPTVAGSALPTVVINAVGGGAGAAVAPQFFRNGSATVQITGALRTLANSVNATTNNTTATGTAPAITAGTGYTANATVTYTGGTLQASSGAISIQSAGNVTVTGTLTGGDATGTTTVATPAITVRGTNVDTSAATLTTTGVVTLNATAGSVVMGATTGANATLTATGGNISQSLATILTTTNTTGTTTINTTGAALMGTNTNVLAANSLLAITTGANSAVKANGNLQLAGLNSTGDLTIDAGAGNLIVGTGAGTAATAVNVTGNLSLTAAAGITDGDYSAQTVGGVLTLNTTNTNVTLDAGTVNGIIAPRVSYGRVNSNVGTGTLAVSETTTLNLGDITAANLSARSLTGGVIDSGNLTVSGTLTVNVPATQEVVIDGALNSIAALSIANAGNVTFVSNGAAASVASSVTVPNLTIATTTGTKNINLGTLWATNLSVNAAGKVDVQGTVTVGNNATLTAGDTTATAIDDTTGSLIVTGVTTLAATGTGGGISLNTGGKHDFSSVVLNGASGAVSVFDVNNLTISGNTTGTVAATSGHTGLASSWNLVLGNLTVGGLTAIAGNGNTTGTNSGTLTQATGTTVRSEGAVSFATTNAAITVNNTGNNFGGVTATVGSGNNSAATIAIREYGTMKLVTLTSNGSNATLTSETESIIEQTAGNTRYTITNGTLTLNAANGSINLGGLTKVSGTTDGGSTSIRATAPNGAVQLFSNATSANLTLGNITANSLAVNYTGNRTLAQNGWARVYGSSVFAAGTAGTSGGHIALSNTTNNFGRISLTARDVTGNISITEEGTLNLGTVSMPAASTGMFSATSVKADIIDTGLASVKPGGVVGTSGNGTVTLSALNGNITLDDPTTDFPTTGGVVFNGKNVTLSPLGGSGAAPIFLGAAGVTSTAGNLTVTSATGPINQAGNVTVTGDAVFQTGNQPIALTQAGNQFGTVRFVGSSVKITENNDMVLVTNSAATGLTEFTSGGNITVENRGGIINLGSAATATTLMSATGSITLPKLVQATGTITLTASGTKDLGALSLSADLSGKTPNNLGTGSYVPPLP